MPTNQAVYLPSVSSGELVAQVVPTAEPTTAPTTEPAAEVQSCSIVSYPETITQWCWLIDKYAAETELPAALIAAVMWQESGGDPDAYSYSGAVGLLQVMPRDGIAEGFGVFGNRPTINELQDPEFNVKYGTGMLAGLVNKYGSYRDALLHYGPMNVGYYYADKVLAIYNVRK